MFRKLSLAAALFSVAQSAAHAEGHGIALKAGALGLGVEYTHDVSDRLAFRVGLNGSRYGFDQEESGIDYDFDLVWDSIALGVDFHPLKSPFRLSLGLLDNDNRLEAVSRPTQNVTVGDTVYTPAQVGTLIGRVGFNSTAPFLGVGWDWSRHKEHFGVSFDLGVLDQGSPEVSLRGTGQLLGNPSFEQDINAEEAELQDSLGDYDLLPYATLGFVFRF
jgi:opacity protein-like surface antigen